MTEKFTAIIPVKMSRRLPGKHLLKIGSKTLIETVIDKVSPVCKVEVYSRIDLPVPYVRDNSENIMQLLSTLSRLYDTFIMVGGDMPFFTVDDIRLLISSFKGTTTVPRHSNGRLEPLFAIYSGILDPGRNLESMILSSGASFIDAGSFSKLAFFNINTMDDYRKAIGLLSDHDVRGEHSS